MVIHRRRSITRFGRSTLLRVKIREHVELIFLEPRLASYASPLYTPVEYVSNIVNAHLHGAHEDHLRIVLLELTGLYGVGVILAKTYLFYLLVA